MLLSELKALAEEAIQEWELESESNSGAEPCVTIWSHNQIDIRTIPIPCIPIGYFCERHLYLLSATQVLKYIERYRMEHCIDGELDLEEGER
jgi:hypothetical protein